MQFRYARAKSGISQLFFPPCQAYARPPSIEGKAVHSNPPALYRGKAVQVGKSLCTCQTSRRTPSGLHAIRGAPRALYGGRRPCHLSRGGAPVLLTVPIIRAIRIAVNRFFKKFLGHFFSKIMKTHARVVVRKTGENRRKQWFRARESFLKKSEKARKKNFFRRAARLFFENSALCRAPPAPRPPLSCPLSCPVRTAPPDSTRWTGHQRTVKKITYE